MSKFDLMGDLLWQFEAKDHSLLYLFCSSPSSAFSPRNVFSPPLFYPRHSPIHWERVTSLRSFMYKSCLLWSQLQFPLWKLSFYLQKFCEMGSCPCGGNFLFQAGLMYLTMYLIMSCGWVCMISWDKVALIIPNSGQLFCWRKEQRHNWQ